MSALLFIAGCGSDPSQVAKNGNGGEPSEEKEAESSGGVPKSNEKDSAPPSPVVSKLPFKDVDLASLSEGVDQGEKLPQLSGKGADGSAISLEKYAGKVLLIDSWASW